ncbi:MAG: sulfotransferase family 2 domain-containing protein [Candidatus Aminicenantes bacterium]|nr:sulfotransferase family 2 domain-containing protein [Candidatus Aminicenantes bacterium]
MHIPKTAGCSLCTALRLVYRRRDVITLKSPQALQQVSLADLQRYRCYLCHFGAGLYELLKRPLLPCITVVRHPVERAISFIYFLQQQVKKSPEHFSPEYLSRWAPFHEADLRTLLSTDVVNEGTANGQIRALGNIRDFRPFLSDGVLGSHGLLLKGPIENETEKQAMPEMAVNAYHQLENMAVVGITERFAETLVLISDLLGMPLHSHLANVGPQKQHIEIYGYQIKTPPDLIEQVKALTVYDHELYAHACDLFDQQWSRYLAKPRRTYSIEPRLRRTFIEPLRRGWCRASQKWPGLQTNRTVQQAKIRFRRFL